MSLPLWRQGEPGPCQLVSFGGNFENFESKDRQGAWLGFSQQTQELTATIGDHSTVVKILTDKLDRLVEPGADVSFVIVLHRDALVDVRVLKMIGAVGRDVDESGDAQHVQHVLSGSMVGASKVQKGQDFHWTTLRANKTNI